MSEPAPLVFVTVGTDHHRFDRLMDWVDAWASGRPPVRLVVQHGPAHTVGAAECSDFVSPEQFRALLGDAAAVVCSGGPGAVMEARAAGIRPIVVPRRGSLGECVDDHQVSFARFLAARDLVTLVEDGASLSRALDVVLERRDAYAIDVADAAPDGIATIGALVDDLVWGAR